MAQGMIKKDVELLWTNPNPKSSFAGQTIPIDLTDYNAVFVVLSYGSTNSSGYYRYYAFAPCDGSEIATSSCIVENAIVNTRWVTATKTGVQIHSCTRRTTTSSTVGSTNNAYMIPTHIYGIRF